MRIPSTRNVTPITKAAQSYLQSNPGVKAVRGYAQQAFGIATGQKPAPIEDASTKLPKNSQGSKTAQNTNAVARDAFNRIFPKA